MPSYYYSSYLQDVSVGAPLAVVETFRIPAEVLTSGQAITLTNEQIPEMDQLILSTEDLVLCQGVEAVAQAADPTGYDRSRLCAPRPIRNRRAGPPSGQWPRLNCYIDGISYQIAFSQPSDFTLTDQGGNRHRNIHSGTGVHRLPGPHSPAGWWRFPISGRRMGASTWISSPSLTSGRGKIHHQPWLVRDGSYRPLLRSKDTPGQVGRGRFFV